jgi:hypothetical protein
VRGFSVTYMDYLKAVSQVMGFSMAYLEVGFKEEDFNGLPGGWSQVR